jgi:hypothetical protein
MSTVALSGSDTIIINDRILNDLADGDCAVLSFPNQIANVKTGKNGNSIYGDNQTGRQCELRLRLIRGSADDKFLNASLVQQQANFSGFPLITGEFVKQLGITGGKSLADTYILSGGVHTKQVEAKTNTDGDTEQSVSIYSMMFTLAPRAMT